MALDATVIVAAQLKRKPVRNTERMFSRSRPLLHACAALATAACGGDSTEQLSSTGSCRAAASPSLSVGGIRPPAHTFGEVSDAARLQDGRVAVADRQAREISIFDADGDLVQSLGREGEGPGEFLDPVGLAVTPGAILIWDWDQLRVTELSLVSDDVATYRVEGLVNPTHHFGDLASGFVVGSVGFPDGFSESESGSWISELEVVRWDSLRSELDTLVSFRHETSQWVDRSTRLSGSPTFSAEGTFAAGNGRIYWTGGDSALVYSWDAGATGTIQWQQPRRAVSPGDVDKYLERWLARAPETAHRGIREQLAKMPVADYLPTVSDLVPDANGGVWVGIYPAPADTTQTWLRFEGAELTCRVAFPRSFDPTEGGNDWVLGVTTDELDVERIELWELEVL